VFLFLKTAQPVLGPLFFTGYVMIIFFILLVRAANVYDVTFSPFFPFISY